MHIKNLLDGKRVRQKHGCYHGLCPMLLNKSFSSHHCVQLYGETLLVNYGTRLCQVTTLYSLRHSVQDSCTCSQAWCSRCTNRHTAYYCCLLISLTVGLSAKRAPPNAPPRLPRLSRRRRQSHQNSSLFSGSPKVSYACPILVGRQ